MEKLNQYKNIIQKVLEKRATYQISNAPDILKHLVISEDNNDFLLLNIGWHKKRRVHSVVFHIQIKDEKVWVQEDRTDADIASVLAENGIPKSDIVLGFVPEYARKKSEVVVV